MVIGGTSAPRSLVGLTGRRGTRALFFSHGTQHKLLNSTQRDPARTGSVRRGNELRAHFHLLSIAQRRGEALAAVAVPFLGDAREHEGLRVVQRPGPEGTCVAGGVRARRNKEGIDDQHFHFLLKNVITDRRIALVIEDGSPGGLEEQTTARRGPKRTIEPNRSSVRQALGRLVRRS